MYLSGVRESLPPKESSKSVDLKGRIERSASTASAFFWEWGKDRIPFDLATDICGGDTWHTPSLLVCSGCVLQQTSTRDLARL